MYESVCLRWRKRRGRWFTAAVHFPGSTDSCGWWSREGSRVKALHCQRSPTLPWGSLPLLTPSFIYSGCLLHIYIHLSTHRVPSWLDGWDDAPHALLCGYPCSLHRCSPCIHRKAIFESILYCVQALMHDTWCASAWNVFVILLFMWMDVWVSTCTSVCVYVCVQD